MWSSLALTLIALGSAFPGSEAAFQPPRRTVLAIVRDVRTGEPIRTAPVRWLGSDAIAHTDEYGQALLVDDSDEREMRICTEPAHYTVDVRTMRWMQGWNAVELWVQPAHACVSSVLTAASGVTHEFASGGVTVKVIVKPGTFQREVTLGFASFPTWAMEVEEARELPLFLGQLCLLDERGAVLNIPAAHPIGVRISLPFEKQFNEMGFAIAPGQLDPATKGRTWCGNAVDYEAERQLVAFALEVGGSGRMPFFVSQFSRPPGTAHLPEITVDVERTECEAFARRTITCGQSSEEIQLPGKGRTAVVIDPSVGPELAHAIPGAPRIAVELVAARLGLDLSMKFDGSLSATNVAKFPSKLYESANAVGPCFSGTAESMLVRAVYAVKVDGKKIGTITKPIATYVHRSLVHDSSCGAACATPGNPPVDAWNPCQ